MRMQYNIISENKKNFMYYLKKSYYCRKTLLKNNQKCKKFWERSANLIKNSYHGKYCYLKNIYGLCYIKSTINGYTRHLFVFNLFKKNDNYQKLNLKISQIVCV